MPEPSTPYRADDDATAPSLRGANPNLSGGDPSVMDNFQPLGNPRLGEATMPGVGETATSAPYVSYARPIGPGHALAPPIVRGVVVTMVGVLALSWIPIIGPFVAGLIGGWVARGWRGGLLATYVPGFLASILFGIYYFIVPRAFILNLGELAPWLVGILTTGMCLIVMIGGMIGGYVHSLRDHAPKGDRRRVQMG
ncbi:MAG TPA: YrzE family protein [Candidatus Thermoplasmatota archaeon]|nr:YrzE family protein [Candidatus Thermoplasmatota archaeon]